MSNNDGRVIINIDSNAQKVAGEFNALDAALNKTKTDGKAFSLSANAVKKALSALGITYTTSQVLNLGKSLINTSMDFQALTNRMNAAAGNKSIGADSLAYIREQADRLGLEFRTTADSFAGFEAAALRSGLTLEQTKQIFTDVSTAATSMQLSTEKVQLVFKALEQISGKGTVSMEELRQQLGDSLPGAFEIAAQSMGMTTKAFYDAVANGEVLSSEFLPKFAKAIREQLGGSAEEASTQLRASLNRLNTDLMDSANAWGTLLQPSVQKGVEAFRGAAQASTSLANTLNQNQAQIGAVATSVSTATTAFIALRAAAGVQLTTVLATTTTSIAAVRTSLAAMGAAIAANPLMVGGAAIALSIGAVTYALQQNQVALSKETQILKQLANEVSNNATETPRLVAEYHNLATAANRTGEQEQRLIEIKDKLNAQYPDLLSKYGKELNAQGELTSSTSKLIAQYIKLAEVQRIVAQQQAAEAKYNKQVENKWYSVGAFERGRKIKAMNEYTEATNASTAALRKLISQEKAGAKVIQGGQGVNNYSLAPSIGNIGSSSGSSSTEKQKDAFDRLQEAVKNARREVELNAIAYGTSSPQVQQAFEKYRNLNTQLNDINKIFDENTKKVTDNGGAYADLQQKINDTRNQLLNMAVSDQTGSPQFIMLKNTLKEYENKALEAEKNVENYVGTSWKNISQTISSQLSYALTTPLQEGENAFERLGNVALNVIGQIGQSLISQVLNNAIEKIAARGTDGVMTGAAAAVTQTAQGYASMAASTNLAASGISKIASSQTAATAALTSSAATVAGAAATYKTAAVSAGQLASSITQAAISQAAYSAALVPIAGAALAPVAALATGTSIAAANVVASAGMLASRITAFKDGGVVNSPTLFPMAGNRTGIMGEKGAEAIMPLKRAPNGQLGVQAQTAPATVNIYNQSDSRIETVQRPDGETDIFIRRVNNALRNERTQAGFSSALQRNQSRGVQAS